MNVLTRICTDKQDHIRAAKAQTPLSALKEKIERQESPRGFKKKISQNSPALIAEVKKASPSRGLIRADFDPAAIAAAYEHAGASCLSVLTDEAWFQGRDADLLAARAAVSLPVLRKDFMLDPYQIYESRALGADCILLIMAALEDGQARDLAALATELGMDILSEIHDREELERAVTSGATMIGINNRNLKTLDVTLETALSLAPLLPPETVKIAESGIETREQLLMLNRNGFSGFLVGESLMKQPDIEQAVKNLLPAP